ncbi:hypothetical protein [Corynebacterium sp.]|uniref:hypothetical protein n=1 Tax=Corynebacterium sp. TaxID=1720 RepID=UPI0026DDB81B|nr:hypothetical protein [Corynebacterium sp.]MDO5075937.1 hypothetical protein [Corynebacterium sp.]
MTQLTTVRPQPTALPRTTTPTRRRFQHTPGSRQVVSVRGRRVPATHKADPKVVKFLVLVTGVLCGGIVTTIGLSGVSTEQTFRLQELHAQETQLNNELETLHRDVETARSSAEIARRAADLGMVVPDQPGVLEVAQDGTILELRPADPSKTQPIIDVNGKRVNPSRASSNPDETRDVSDSLNPIPQSNQQRPSTVPGVTPYAPRNDGGAQ